MDIDDDLKRAGPAFLDKVEFIGREIAGCEFWIKQLLDPDEGEEPKPLDESDLRIALAFLKEANKTIGRIENRN